MQLTPFYEGAIVNNSFLKYSVAGRQITEILARQKAQEGFESVLAEAPPSMTQDIKERICYVALDFEEQCASALPDIARDYMLPGGETISVSSARFKASR